MAKIAVKIILTRLKLLGIARAWFRPMVRAQISALTKMFILFLVVELTKLNSSDVNR